MIRTRICRYAASVLAWIVAGLFCMTANAQLSVVVPRLVNFSGRATDSQGRALSGIAGATFAIYKDQYDGPPLWLETQNIQADGKGSFIVHLGATKPEGLPLDLFTSGEARWLGVTINGGPEQPRVLLLSVPYALKAADAETIGGLPPSAFVLAAPPVSGTTTVSATTPPVTASPSATPPTTSNVTTTGGTVNALPLWTTSTNVQSSALTQSGSGTTAKIGINTSTPGSTLDVNGAETVRGNLTLPATGTATATAGKNSQGTTLTASAFNSGTAAAVAQNFRWQAEPAGNNTTSPAGTLNLLYGSGSNPIAETGLKVNNKGQVTFAAGQTFPGTGTVASVSLSAPSSDFTVTGSPVTKSGTLGLTWNVAPTNLNTPNSIVKRDSGGSFFAQSVSATQFTASNVTASNPAGVPIIASTSAPNAAISGTNTNTNALADGVDGVTNSGFAAGVAGINNGSGFGVYGSGGTGVFGTGSNLGFQTDSNVQQARTMGGWVKAMASVNGETPPYMIMNCFNSYLVGPAATTPPCGISFTEVFLGFWTLDFGFQVVDRVVSATLYDNAGGAYCISASPGIPAVAVSTSDCGGNGQGANFSVVVF